MGGGIEYLAFGMGCGVAAKRLRDARVQNPEAKREYGCCANWKRGDPELQVLDSRFFVASCLRLPDS